MTSEYRSGILTAPTEVQAAFLRGFFGADGCVSRVEAGGKANRYVGLGSRSNALLKDVQRLLSSWGIRGRIYRITDERGRRSPIRARTDTVRSTCRGRASICASREATWPASRPRSASPLPQAGRVESVMTSAALRTKATTTMVAREDDGQETVYNLTEPLHHSYIVDGFVVANCSEYMHVDDSACNLASLNLMKFRRADGTLTSSPSSTPSTSCCSRRRSSSGLQLPDRGDRRERARVSPARPRLRESRRLPDEQRHAL